MIKRRIVKAIDQIAQGNLGDYKSIHGYQGLFERRLDVGPGYRLYFVLQGRTLIILLYGGTKRSQRKDIEKAWTIWKYRKEHNEK